MKSIGTILSAAAALVVIVEFLQRQRAQVKDQAATAAAVTMNPGASKAPQWWESGTPDNITAVECQGCSTAAPGQWEKYGVLPPYKFVSG